MSERVKTSSTPQRMSRAALTALVLLTTLNLLNFIDRYILPGAQPLIQADFHVSDQRMGALTTALFLTYMLTAPLTGWLGDRFRRKPLIIAGAVLWSLATLATYFVHDYWTLYFRHAIVGIGEATFTIFAPAVISDFFPPRERNRILSIFYLAIPVGAALGFTLGGQLGERFGWRTPFFLCALPGLVVALLYGLFASEPARGASETATKTASAPSNPVATILSLFLNPAYLFATLGMAMLVFAMGGISTWMPTFLHRFSGMSVSKAGTSLGVITVIDGLAGTAIGGWIGQRWLRRDPRALYLVSAWSMIATLPLGALVFFGPPAWSLPALFAAEFFLFLNTGPLNTAIINSVRAEVRASAIALNLFLIHMLGDTFSPQIIGAIGDRSNLRLGLGLTLVTLAISGILLFTGARFAPNLERNSTELP
ncbi:MAG TPA: MFS transporter [Acidobacteriaceae bacterium]|nr:MFS transporter [Acidobacteriaceae bacterium]